jgi:hypothetical protein
MSKNIYDQHRAAFANVSAYCVVDAQGERVASVAFKYPRDGAGRLYCYLHVFGVPMVRGSAGGCGYDKHSAAAQAAARLVKRDGHADTDKSVATITNALSVDGGYTWQQEVERTGYRVYQAV